MSAWLGMDQIWWGVGQIYTNCKMQPKNGAIILNENVWLSLLVFGLGMTTAAARKGVRTKLDHSPG
jgi:hypothetical protein